MSTPAEIEPALNHRLAGALVVAGAVGLYLSTHWDYLMTKGAFELNQGVMVGRVLKVRPGVRYRPVGSVLWREFVADTADAREGDAIFTDGDGLARLELRNGVTAEIQPNSLVVIRQSIPPDLHTEGLKTVFSALSPKQPVLDIGAGHLNLSFNKEATVGLQSGDKARSFVSSQGKAAIEATRETNEAGQIRLSAAQDPKQGFVLVDASDEPVELNPGETVNITSGDPVKPEPRLTSSVEPEDDSIVFALPGEPVRLAWKWKVSFVEKGDTVLLNLDGPVSKLQKLDADSNDWKLDLPSGLYHWRLEIIREQYVFRTPKVSFEVRRFEAPRLLGPADGAKLAAGTASPGGVSLTYEKLARGALAQIELVDEDGKQATRLVPGGPLGADITLPQGRYRWRARAFAGEKNEFDSGWSRTYHFAVTTAAPGAVAPQLER